jgi:hypothetical protein
MGEKMLENSRLKPPPALPGRMASQRHSANGRPEPVIAPDKPSGRSEKSYSNCLHRTGDVLIQN